MAWLSDEEYIYRQDIKDKKSAGRGAFHKKGGSKSKKCNFPSDYLTKKEREAMNGEVMTYNPNAWYTWEEFKKLPSEYQTKYVNSLMTRYDCSFTAIAEVVFKKKIACVWGYLKRNDSLKYINMPDPTVGKKLLPGKQRLKEAYELAINIHEDAPEEIQNGSNVVNDIIEEAKEDEPYESPQSQINKSITDAIDTITLYAKNGVPMPPEKIDEIFMEKCGMTRAEAEKVSGLTWDNPGEPVEEIEDSTDVKSFSIIMDHIDMDIIQYVSGLFEGKKIVVSFEVKEAP